MAARLTALAYVMLRPPPRPPLAKHDRCRCRCAAVAGEHRAADATRPARVLVAASGVTVSAIETRTVMRVCLRGARVASFSLTASTHRPSPGCQLLTCHGSRRQQRCRFSIPGVRGSRFIAVGATKHGLCGAIKPGRLITVIGAGGQRGMCAGSSQRGLHGLHPRTTGRQDDDGSRVGRWRSEG